MNGEETEQKQTQPEEARGTFPVIMNGENQTHKRNKREKIAEYLIEVIIYHHNSPYLPI